MSEPVTFHQETQEGTSSTVTVLKTDERDAEVQEVPTLKLKLRKPKTDRKVQWSNETVDNEHMNKKKSKCCCIYDKPKKFGESSSEDESEDECDHCHGHVERKKKNQSHTEGESSSTVKTDPTQTITVDN